MTVLSLMCALCLALGLSCLIGIALTVKRSGLWSQPSTALPATCDLLDYATLATDHVIVLKSGGLLALYELTPPDLSVMSASQVALTYELAQKALLKLVGNYCIHVDLLRERDNRYYPELEPDAGLLQHEGAATHQVLRQLEDERICYCAQHPALRSRLVLSITYLGTDHKAQHLERLITKPDHEPTQLKRRGALRPTPHHQTPPRSQPHSQTNSPRGTLSTLPQSAAEDSRALVHEFELACASVVATLELCFQVKPLGPERNELGNYTYHAGLSHIQECLSGHYQELRLPTKAVYLDALLGSQDFIHGFMPKLGPNYISVIALEGLPQMSEPGCANALGLLPFPYRLNTRFIYFDQLKSTYLLGKYRRFWAQKSKGILAQLFNLPEARLNQNALDQMADIDKAKRALDNNEVVFGAYCGTLLIYHHNPKVLAQYTRAALQAIERAGLIGRVESINATEAFLGSLPGHYYENLRRPIVSQDVVLDLLPLQQPILGEAHCPNPLMGTTRSPLMQVRVKGASNYLLNLHDHDLGHTLIIGPTGAGKSVLLGALMLNLLRYQGMRIFAFDKGYSFYALTKALGGTHLTFSNDKAQLCPLYELETDLQRDYAVSFIETLLRLSQVEVSAEQRNELITCINLLASQPQERRSLSDFYVTTQIKAVRTALAPYTTMGGDLKALLQHLVAPSTAAPGDETQRAESLGCATRSPILDGRRNLAIGKSALTTFECAEIFASTPAFAVPVLKQVFHLIEQQFDGRPAAIVLDEAWLMLQDPVFAQELLKWFKTLRKFNVAVILATQSLADLKHSGLWENLLDCAKTRFFLANCDAGSAALKDAYLTMGLSPTEIEALVHATPKRDYYFCKGSERIMLNLILPPDELALLSIAGDHHCARVDALYQRFGPTFYRHLNEPQPSAPPAPTPSPTLTPAPSSTPTPTPAAAAPSRAA